MFRARVLLGKNCQNPIFPNCARKTENISKLKFWISQVSFFTRKFPFPAHRSFHNFNASWRLKHPKGMRSSYNLSLGSLKRSTISSVLILSMRILLFSLSSLTSSEACPIAHFLDIKELRIMRKQLLSCDEGLSGKLYTIKNKGKSE